MLDVNHDSHDGIMHVAPISLCTQAPKFQALSGTAKASFYVPQLVLVVCCTRFFFQSNNMCVIRGFPALCLVDSHLQFIGRM